jgi:A/G-specific adenine glycosylase
MSRERQRLNPTSRNQEPKTLSLSSQSNVRFRRCLLAWYDRRRRELPWRGERDPYRVWVSEVMLQQTRVAAVIEYYRKFLQQFPDVRSLATARLAKVLAAWSGLGYYRRARMMHAAAREIVKARRGVFPQTAEDWHGLPGIGRYTAAAIASIAFGEAVALVDGNVERVLERLQGRTLAGAEAWQAAGSLLSKKRPGDFNQAMMELGATVCLPRQPNCGKCPVRAGCATRGALPAGHPEARRKAEIAYGLNCRNGSVLLVRRPANASLMGGMWELPELSREYLTAPGNGDLVLRHSITVTDYGVRVVRQAGPADVEGKWVARKRLETLPLTGLTRKILRAAKII